MLNINIHNLKTEVKKKDFTIIDIKKLFFSKLSIYTYKFWFF